MGGGSYKANRNGSGDVQGLCSCAQALMPALDMAPSGFPSHTSMRDALQAVHKTHEVFGPISDAHGYNLAKTRAVIEDAVVKSMVAQIKLPVNAGGDVCARVAGEELEAAANTVTVPTSPTDVQAIFVGFDDDQPQVHEVGSSAESEVHITSVKCSCERCKMSSLSAAPSSSEFCGSKFLLASLEPPPSHMLRRLAAILGTAVAPLQPPPIPSASESCAETWKTLVASLEDPPIPFSRNCCGLWKTAIASLEPPPIPSASRGCQGQSQSHKKRRVIGTVLRKPAAFGRLPRSSVLVSWRALSRSYDVGNLRAFLRRHIFCRGVANSLVRWLVSQKAAANIFLENVTELKNCLGHGAITRRAAAQSWLSQLPQGTVFIVT